MMGTRPGRARRRPVVCGEDTSLQRFPARPWRSPWAAPWHVPPCSGGKFCTTGGDTIPHVYPGAGGDDGTDSV